MTNPKALCVCSSIVLGEMVNKNGDVDDPNPPPFLELDMFLRFLEPPTPLSLNAPHPMAHIVPRLSHF